MNDIPVTENELHAYVDAALTATRRAQVEAHLSANPEDAARVQAWQAQKQALRALCNPVLEEALPERLLVAAAPAAAVNGLGAPFLARWSLARIAAGLLVAVLGGVAGWFGHARYQPLPTVAQPVPLPRQAAVAHVVFSPDVRRPVEVRAEQEDQLVTWLSKRLGTPVRPPKLGALGYELIGGRLLPGNSGPVAQFMYHDASGQRLTLYVSTENATHRDTAFRFAQEGQVNVFYWVDGTFGYALSASIAKGELARVATAVYDQLERKSDTPNPDRK
jgi:anti-sigma factor RsiW